MAAACVWPAFNPVVGQRWEARCCETIWHQQGNISTITHHFWGDYDIPKTTDSDLI
jgi:hypothetical protein